MGEAEDAAKVAAEASSRAGCITAPDSVGASVSEPQAPPQEAAPSATPTAVQAAPDHTAAAASSSTSVEPGTAEATAGESTAAAGDGQGDQGEGGPGSGDAAAGGGDASASAAGDGDAAANGDAAASGKADGDAGDSEARKAERLARAEALKQEGNELFGRGMWDDAAAKYDAAMEAAPSDAPQRAIYFANLAACNIKTQQYAGAVQSCTAALALDPLYGKALMRRCEAFERLDELDHALADARKMLEAFPDNAWAKAKVAALEPVVAERTEKLKAEMLGKLKDLGNTLLGKFGLSTDNFKFEKDPNTGSYSIKFQQ